MWCSIWVSGARSAGIWVGQFPRAAASMGQGSRGTFTVFTLKLGGAVSWDTPTMGEHHVGHSRLEAAAVSSVWARGVVVRVVQIVEDFLAPLLLLAGIFLHLGFVAFHGFAVALTRG